MGARGLRSWVGVVASAAAFLACTTGPENGTTTRSLAAFDFQPGFHQALGESYTVGSSRLTNRQRIPVGRAGARLRLSFLAGTGTLTVDRVTVARAGASGALASPPLSVTFRGAPGFTASARTLVTSDPFELPVSFGEELYVSTELRGVPAVGGIELFPESYAAYGSYATSPGRFGSLQPNAVALATIEVEGPTGRAVVAIGDSITEGYTSGDDDYRDGWPAQAERRSRLPFANAGVSGADLQWSSDNLGIEVLSLSGITDCVVLHGTNDLGKATAEQISSQLAALFDRLRPFCKVWAGTLLPKENDGTSSWATRASRRRAVNAWIRESARVEGVIDFEAVTRSSSSPDVFRTGYGEDGIHPTPLGYQAMAEEAVRVLFGGGGSPPDAGTPPPDAGTPLPDAGTPPPDAGTPPPDAGTPPPDGGAPLPDAGTPPPSGPPVWKISHSNSSYELRAVGADGTAYATQIGGSSSRLYASTDDARTWAVRGSHPRGSAFRMMAALADGVLLANVTNGGTNYLARSVDQGRTWVDVLNLGAYRMLQPRNVVELGGTVFLAEYQSFTGSNVDIHLWASTDRGATWSVRHIFKGRRHAHGLVADPARNELWALLGDYTGGILISNDLGRTWRVVYEPVAVVDAIATPRGLLFGTDTLFKPDPAVIVWMDREGGYEFVYDLPGPEYSIHAPRAGGYLLETSREVKGDIYPPGDVSAHLFASATGDDWRELFRFPRMSSTSDTHCFARWELRTGEVVVQLENVQQLAPSGKGYLLIRRE